MGENNKEEKKQLVITGSMVLRFIGILAIIAGIVNVLLVVFGSLEFEVYLLLITFVPGFMCLVLGRHRK